MILVIVAHPDDESLFCGATIAKHVGQGEPVHVVSLGNGVGARGGSDDALTSEIIARSKAFHQACGILGATGYLHLSCPVFPDQMSDTVPQISINRAVENHLSIHKPTLVYTHHVGDLNVDHRRVAEAVLVATRMGPVVRCMTPEFPERCVGPKFRPNVHVFFGLEPTEKKIAACRCYATEMRESPHPRSEQALRQVREAFMEIR